MTVRRLAHARSTIAPAVVLLLGALFRFAWLGTVRHGYDNAYQIYDAVRLLDGGEWLLIGQPSSVFLDNPPLMAYLQSVALLVWRSPWSAYLLVTALNTAAIWFVYALGRDLKGEPYGLLAGLLFALNPWVVHFSRMTWTQGLLPFFLTVAAWGLWPTFATERREPRRFLLGLLAVAAMIQTYVLALAVLAPLAVLLVAFRERLPRRALQAGLLALLLSLGVYTLGLSTRLTPNLEKLARFASGDDEAGVGFSLEAGEHMVRLITGNKYGADLATPGWLDTLMGLVHLLLLAALVIGAIQAFRALWGRTTDRQLSLALFAWLLLPVLGFALLPFPVHPHYLLLTLPAGQFLAAWGLHALLEQSAFRPVLAGLLIVAGLTFGLALRQTALASAATAVGGSDFDGWALSAAAAAGGEIREATADVPGYPRRISAGGNSVLLSGASAAYLEVVGDLSYPDYVLLPGTAPFVYVLTRQEPQPGALGPHEERLPSLSLGPDDGSSVAIVRVGPYSRTDGLALPATGVDWSSEAGLTLLGYGLGAGSVRAGEMLPVTTTWRVDALLPERGGWYTGAYYQILDENWQLRANVSGHGQWGWRWTIGDTYIERTSVPLPEEPGEYRLLIGLHDPIHDLGFALQSPDGPQPFLAVPLVVTP